MTEALSYAALHSFSRLKPLEFECDAPRQNEIKLAVMFCGACHSDIHQVKNEWSNTVYPCMLGHEVVGCVTRIGDAVRLLNRASRRPSQASDRRPDRSLRLATGLWNFHGRIGSPRVET